MLPKVDGIYDIRTVNQLLELGVKRFSFDLRPRSMNFIQHYRVIEIISQVGLRHDITFCFHFADEHPMLIEKFINDLAAETGADDTAWTSGRLELEFSGREDFGLLDTFNVPYRWHLFKGADWARASKAKNLRGLVIPFEYVEDALEHGTLTSLCTNLHTTFRNMQFHLSRSWGANMFASLADLFDFEDVALAIDPNVETCFRNVDPSKLATGIRPFLHAR